MSDLEESKHANGKIIDINEGKKKKKGSKKSDLIYLFISAINKSPHSIWPEFPYRFKPMQGDQNMRIPVLVDDNNVVSYYSEAGMMNHILDYSINQLGRYNIDMNVVLAKEIVSVWIASTKPLRPEDVIPIAEKDSEELAFQRLPFNFDKELDKTIEKDCVVYKELLNRMSNNKAFKIWVGSLFDPKSSNQQYVWLYGRGRNGKSSLGRIFSRLLGNAVRFDQPPSGGSQFWTSGLLGKRLIILPDCNAYKFITGGLFKSLTGGDSVRVERKGKDSYCAKMDGKFMIFSNEKPALTGDESDTRRAIFCEIGAIDKEFGSNYEDLLWSETKIFISECYHLYKNIAGSPKHIDTEEDSLDEIITANEEIYEDFFERFISKGNYTPEESLKPTDLQNLFRQELIRYNRDQRQYLGYFSREHGVERKRFRLKNGQLVWRYSNAKLKELENDEKK